MQLITHAEYGGERPLYAAHDLRLEDVTIHVGESSIKESRNIEARDCRFEGKYVFWECRGFDVENCYFAESARSSLWYSERCRMRNCQVDAPKMFRRMKGIDVADCRFPNALETFWDCSDITLRNVGIARADYLFMHCHDIRIDHYRQDGNYSFQYARNVEIHDAVINSKDAFWEAENVTVYDSELNGEYLAWYGRNIRLVRCHLTGEQLLCYVDGLVLEDCTFGPDANLLFEYSTVQATIRGDVTSIKNPTSGRITVDGHVGEIIIDGNQRQPADAVIQTQP
ncbi:MAG: DUF3737 family protein [Bacteroidales bacterium]|nr:DUF3737 family protein [Candidatus Liminaster caballi]